MWAVAPVTTKKPGALRDMVANHLLQLLTLTAMEPPVAFDADSRARRESAGVAIDSSHEAGAGRGAHSARAIWTRRDRWREGQRLQGRGGRRSKIYRLKLTRRLSSIFQTGAGRECRFTCAPAKVSRATLTEIAVHLKRTPQASLCAHA